MKINYRAWCLLMLMAAVMVLSACHKNSSEDTHTEPDKLAVTDGSGCRIPKQTPDYILSYGFPRDPARQRSTGTVKVAVIFVDYPDAPAWRAPQDVLAMMSPSAENFLNTVSHGKLNVVLAPDLKWYRMAKVSTSYGFNHLTFELHQSYIQQAVNLATVDYDFSKTDVVLIISNPDATALSRSSSLIGTAANGIFADGKVITNAVTYLSDIRYFQGLGFAHELGHTMGLPDLYSYAGTLHGYVGDFSIMGNVLGTAPTYNAWEQWEFGWVADSQVSCISGKGSGTQELSPVEGADGRKLLVFPIDHSTAVIAEDRRATGYDSNLQKEGPLVYLVDTRINNGEGVIKVLPINTNDQLKRDAPLSAGQTVIYKNLTIECKASSIKGSTIAFKLD